MLQVELKKYKPQIEAYLPEDVYVAVGSTVELYNDEVVWSGLKVWLCLQLGLYQVGENLEDRFSITGKEEQVGDYSLTLTVFDYNVNELMTLKSTLHVVEKLEGRILGAEYRRQPFGRAGVVSHHLPSVRRADQHLREQEAGHGTVTRGAADSRPRIIWSRRSIHADGASEGVQPFYDPVQEMFDWKYYKLSTGIGPGRRYRFSWEPTASRTILPTR